MKTEQAVLYRDGVSSFVPVRSSRKDRRRKVAYCCYTYIDYNGDLYSKSFEAPIGTTQEQFNIIAPLEIKVRLNV